MTSLVREGRGALRAIRRRLMRPSAEAIVECLPDLESAIRCLSGVEGALERREAGGVRMEELRSEMRGFRQELREANALLRNAADFYLDCLTLLASGSSGYDYSGQAVLGMPAGRHDLLAMEG